eukprot:150937_1
MHPIIIIIISILSVNLRWWSDKHWIRSLLRKFQSFIPSSQSHIIAPNSFEIMACGKGDGLLECAISIVTLSPSKNTAHNPLIFSSYYHNKCWLNTMITTQHPQYNRYW